MEAVILNAVDAIEADYRKKHGELYPVPEKQCLMRRPKRAAMCPGELIVKQE